LCGEQVRRPLSDLQILYLLHAQLVLIGQCKFTHQNGHFPADEEMRKREKRFFSKRKKENV
jgi:hypothetical protein